MILNAEENTNNGRNFFGAIISGNSSEAEALKERTSPLDAQRRLSKAKSNVRLFITAGFLLVSIFLVASLAPPGAPRRTSLPEESLLLSKAASTQPAAGNAKPADSKPAKQDAKPPAKPRPDQGAKQAAAKPPTAKPAAKPAQRPRGKPEERLCSQRD
eukprot:CAMPEP_0172159596 /NCGR_PEP_ID=MMETSP1050-20130122/5062_1 /TAXON_ID=233186 /ORGANISM="Cryptomonas curvata, Strain CCAP979/52" /LENGTH=157 /DNA_ID=CAMNT_0012829209 /DNA_START=135 /DNA_END=605 /DNA_ORIENTATION=+